MMSMAPPGDRGGRRPEIDRARIGGRALAAPCGELESDRARPDPWLCCAPAGPCQAADQQPTRGAELRGGGRRVALACHGREAAPLCMGESREPTSSGKPTRPVRLFRPAPGRGSRDVVAGGRCRVRVSSSPGRRAAGPRPWDGPSPGTRRSASPTPRRRTSSCRGGARSRTATSSATCGATFVTSPPATGFSERARSPTCTSRRPCARSCAATPRPASSWPSATPRT